MARKVRLMREAPQGDEQIEMFVPDVGDIPLKDKQTIMTLPLLKVGDYRGRAKPVSKVEMHEKGVDVVVTAPSDIGIATIRDYDLILFALSTIRQWMNMGEKPARTLELHAHHFLKFTRRGTGRKQYDDLISSLRRLKATTIFLSAETDKQVGEDGTNWLDKYTYVRDKETGKISTLKITIPEWIYQAAIGDKNILTLHRDYFLLVPQARWLYRIMRKSAGVSEHGWRYNLKTLHQRAGTTRAYSKWRFDFLKLLNEGTENGQVLDYVTNIKTNSAGEEVLYFMKAEKLLTLLSSDKEVTHLHPFAKEWLSAEGEKYREQLMLSHSPKTHI